MNNFSYSLLLNIASLVMLNSISVAMDKTIKMKPSTEYEKAFDDALTQIALNPSNENLTQLRKTIVPQQIRAGFIAERLIQSGLPEKPSPAIGVIAKECPYVFWIANNNSAIDVESALKYIHLGFMYPAVNVKNDGEEPMTIAMTYYPIYLMSKIQSDTQKDYVLQFMRNFLRVGLNLSCEYPSTDGIKRTLSAITEKTKIKNDDYKEELKTMLNVDIWLSGNETDTPNMFHRGSQFNWEEKGKPFVIKTQHE